MKVLGSNMSRLAGVMLLLAILGLSRAAIAESTDATVRDFEQSFRRSLPHCFSTSDLDTIAKEVTGNGVRCIRFSVVFQVNDPHPWKILCMAEEMFPTIGPLLMSPPVVVLTVEGQCVTRVTH
jgi:hypothetical protein